MRNLFRATLRATRRLSTPWRVVFLLAALFSVLAGLGSRVALALSTPAPDAQILQMHPTYTLLDSQGEPVLQTRNPVSTMKTCGTCHDTEFITHHSYHSSVGLDELTLPGDAPGGRPWDISSSLFGRWDPLTYRYLSPVGDKLIDLGTAAWIMIFGARHAGGGPAEVNRDGQPLANLEYKPGDPETSIVDPKTGKLIPWDWQASGVVEMNCFLCHTPSPNNEARIQALQSGAFQWANTATLLGTGIVEQSGDQYSWNPDAFTDNGELKEDFVTIQDPTDANCGQCHGLVHENTGASLVVAGCSADLGRTGTTGQIISPERIAGSGMNLAGKDSLDRSWDIHAERQVKCTDCHYSLNNPIYYQEDSESRPSHLNFDPRRLDIGEYLAKPLHQFARGSSSTMETSGHQDTMRRCNSCHSIENTHNWLPYKDRHIQTLSCETCHVPQIYSPAYQQNDYTGIRPNSSPLTECRGMTGPNGSINSLITGYQPALLQKEGEKSEAKIAPYNLVTSWYWVYGDPERPVRLQDLKAAWLEGDQYHPEILASFDQDGDQALSDREMEIDTPAKQALLAARLESLGLESPHIVGEIQPYSINHDVASGDWAIRDCKTCHGKTSRLSQPVLLASYIPGGVLPKFVKDSHTAANGEIYRNERGELWYQPAAREMGIYVLGKNSIGWVDLLGSLLFFGVLVGTATHGTMRYITGMRRSRHVSQTDSVYMYSVYERFWHWLQTFTILGLLFTGLIIHKPDTFGIFSFRGVVTLHNILAGILLVNAFLSLFYHLASGEIRQYIPHPYGFIDDAISQGLYYVRGIFKGEAHPFEKSTKKKFNPLQQVTYFAILNILLPLQIITGALMWGVQRWPVGADRLGGLLYLAPFHTLIAWLFAAFIVVHVYLTTTGHAPLAGIQSMMVGWDELELRPPNLEEETQS